MGYVLTNCNTCGWPNGARCPLDTDEGLAEHDGLDEWIENNSAAEDQAPAVAYATATGCPGWKPKPAAIAAHDIPGHRPDDLTHVRAQLASLGTKPSAEVTEASLRARIEATFASMATTKIEPETITVKRAAWDATLATIARLESRVESLESRADEAERLTRGVGPRVAALLRKNKLRGNR